MEIIRKLDEANLDPLEKDEEIEEEIADAGVFSEKTFGLIVEIESVLSLHVMKLRARVGMDQRPKIQQRQALVV